MKELNTNAKAVLHAKNSVLFKTSWSIVKEAASKGIKMSFAEAMRIAKAKNEEHSAAQIMMVSKTVRQNSNTNKRTTKPIDYTVLTVESAGGQVQLNEILVDAMQNGIVRFSYRNEKGSVIQTSGTLIKEMIPVNKRKIEGRRMTKQQGAVTFYDSRHGMFRTYVVANLINISRRATYA